MKKYTSQRKRVGLIESLESRVLLSANSFDPWPVNFGGGNNAGQPGPTVSHPIAITRSRGVRGNALGTTSPVGLTPAQLSSAYGVNQIMFGGVQGDGRGQTIAIIDGFNFPTALNDVNAFSSAMGLVQFNSGAGTPTFTVVNQTGGAPVAAATDPAGAGNANGTWEQEEALDIEWAHAIAPKANITLVECYDSFISRGKTKYELTLNDLFAGINWARQQTGVSVVSMSWSATDSSSLVAENSIFTTPSGHAGVTFLASTGDSGEPSGYPAYSPNVVAVGGTTLRVNGSDYVSESGWSGSGGGVSSFEAMPSYQSGLGYGNRAVPDVSMLADPNTGVAVYDTWDFGSSTGWFNGTFGGTSLSTPMWAGLMAIVDQGRASVSLSSLDGATQTLPALYALPASDFHDIITGNNGAAAGPGYDLVTGRGTPIADRLVPDLVGVGSIAGTVFQDNNSDGVKNGSDVALSGVSVYLDSNGNGVRDAGGITNFSNSTALSIPDVTPTGTVSKITVSNVAGPITDVNVTLTIAHSHDADLTVYLVGPDGTEITLFSGIGSSGANFTNTTLDDSAATSISAASAPFTGTFKPTGPGALAAFNGLTANGTWKLIAVDGVSGNTGSISSWSLAITTGPETGMATDGSGNYTLGNLHVAASYTVRQVVPVSPLNYVQTSPVVGATTTVTTAATTLNFTDFPTVFSTSAAGVTYSLSVDAATHSKLQISDGTTNYLVAFSLLPLLTFNLTGTGDVLSVDFTNSVGGAMLPSGGIQFTGNGSQELRVTGQNGAQSFAMTDTQIGPTGPVGTPAIVYANIATMTLATCTVNYNGSFSTFGNLNIGANTIFNWV